LHCGANIAKAEQFATSGSQTSPNSEPPVRAAFAFYGVGWAVYSHFMARGVDVVFPKNTPVEVRFGTPEDAPPPNPTQHFISQVAKSSKIS
jgi:hypothetical protein